MMNEEEYKEYHKIKSNWWSRLSDEGKEKYRELKRNQTKQYWKSLPEEQKVKRKKRQKITG